MDNPPSPALMKLAAAIRRHRKRAGHTQMQLAELIPCSDKTISALETGRDRPSREMVVAIEKALDLPPDVLVDLYDLLDSESLPGWMRDWVVEERRSSTLRSLELSIVPGLLQIEEYARVVLNGNEAMVQARMERQSILTVEAPPALHVVMDEAILYREIGGPKVMNDQLTYLTECVSDDLTVQIVTSDVNPSRLGAFLIATLASGGEVAYVETAVRGIVTSGHDDIARLNSSWEKVRSHALSQRESLDFIRRTVVERWT